MFNSSAATQSDCLYRYRMVVLSNFLTLESEVEGFQAELRGLFQDLRAGAVVRRSTEATYLLSVRCPAYRGRDSSPGFRTELENLGGDAERRGQVTLGEIESTGNRRNSLSCRKAAAFQGWHEPDESRDSRPAL
jgi:hypothetical protein